MGPTLYYFILSGFKYYVLTFKNKYNVLIVLMLYCKSLLVLRDRCGGMGRFKGKGCNYIN